MTPSETKIVELVKLALGSAGGTGADLCRTGGQGDAGYIDDITPALRGKSLWMIPRHERLTLAWADAHVESLSTSDGSDLNHPRPGRDRCRYPRGAHAAARSSLVLPEIARLLDVTVYHLDQVLNIKRVIGEGATFRVEMGIMLSNHELKNGVDKRWDGTRRKSFEKGDAVAIKKTRDPRDHEAFHRELRALSRYGVKECPNVAQLHGIWWYSDDASPRQPAMVMEYVAGPTLTQLLDPAGDRHPLPWEAKRIIIEGVLTGLKYIHESHVIHHDVKLENVLVNKDADGHIVEKLTDFGFSVAWNSAVKEVALAATGIFSAPELEPIPASVAVENLSRLDLYSFGLLALQIALDGREPLHLVATKERLEDAKDIQRLKSQSDLVYRLLDILKEEAVQDVPYPAASAPVVACVQLDPSHRIMDHTTLLSLVQGGTLVRKHPADVLAPYTPVGDLKLDGSLFRIPQYPPQWFERQTFRHRPQVCVQNASALPSMELLCGSWTASRLSFDIMLWNHDIDIVIDREGFFGSISYSFNKLLRMFNETQHDGPAAEQHYLVAQQLSYLCFMELGTPRNYAKALHFNAIAAGEGSSTGLLESIIFSRRLHQAVGTDDMSQPRLSTEKLVFCLCQETVYCLTPRRLFLNQIVARAELDATDPT